jgi:hypothetical protein
MFFTWLFLGAVIGVIGGLGKGGGIQIVCMMIGGMAVLPIVGVLLGLIGGDAKGCVVGAVGGLLGCWIAGCIGTVPIQPQTMNVIVIFGALLGATSFQFVRFLLWKYRMMFRTICWVIGATPASGKNWVLWLTPFNSASSIAQQVGLRARRVRRTNREETPGQFLSWSSSVSGHTGFRSAHDPTAGPLGLGRVARRIHPNAAQERGQ